MKKLVARILIILFATGLFLPSCIEDNFDFEKLSDQIELRPTFVVPIATGSLTLANAIKPGENVVFDPDNMMRLIFREDSIIHIRAADLFEIPQQTSVSKVFNLGPILLDDFDFSQSILLDEMKENMGEPLKTYFESNDGETVVFPAIGPISLGSYTADLVEDFEYVYFTTGTLEITLTNQLPVAVTITLEIRNTSDNSLVGMATFLNLQPGNSATESINLTGIRVENELDFSLSLFETPGSSPNSVLIDLNDDLLFFVEGKTLRVDRGRAFIADQVIEAQQESIDIEVDDGEELYKIDLSRGRIDYEVSSSVSDGLYLSLIMPETKKDGQAVTYLLELQQVGGGAINGSFDLAGTQSDLTKDPLQAFNKLPVDYEVGIRSSGQMITFDLTGDDINFTLSVQDVEFYYVEGWLGEKVVDVNEEEINLENDFFDKVTGEIRLTNPMVSLEYANSFGIPVRMNFNMTGYGKESETVVLNPPVINFLAPSDTLQGLVSQTVEINRDNSSIVDMIALPPRKIDITGSASANPGGVADLNFVKGSSYFLVNLEVDIPLELQITDLVFTDTLDLNIEGELDIVEKAYMHFTVENGFPFDLTLDLFMIDSVSNSIMQEFNNIVIMESAPVNSDGVVPTGQKVVSNEKIELDRAIIDQMILANQLVIVAKMSTSESGTVPVKLLSNYEIGFKIRIGSSLIIN